MFEDIDPWMIPLGFFFFICTVIGVIGNFIMILVSVRNKRLRSGCHLLIAINCAADFIHECGQFPFVYSVFTNTIVRQSNCYLILFFPLIGATIGSPLILSMGIDRMLAIALPGRYRLIQEDMKKYMILQLLFPVFYSGALLTMGFFNRIEDEFTCAMPVGLLGKPWELFTNTGIALYVIIIVIYAVAAQMLRKMGGGTRFKAVFKSMAITVSLVVFGWLFTMIVNQVSFFVTDVEYYRQLMQQYAGIMVNASLASNVFVYYFHNKEYRETIKALFGSESAKAKMEFSVSGTTAAAPPANFVSKRSESLPVNLSSRNPRGSVVHINVRPAIATVS